MELTKKQKEGLKIAIERFKARCKFTVIAGFAGSGKTTLIKSIIDALPDDLVVAYATYTGKAASVLSRKGNKEAITLHKLLYHTKKNKDGEFIYDPRKFLEADVVVVDECSMVPKDMVDLLLSYNVYVIFTGDPGQLPPVKDDGRNNLLDEPHIFLDEIMRQAAESDIIRLSMDVREGRPLSAPYNGKDVKIFDARNISQAQLFAYLDWGDEVLVGTNATRKNINNAMRTFYGREGAPQNGDKVICMKNEWEEFSSDENPLVNGTVGYLRDSFSSYRDYFVPSHKEDDKLIGARNVTMPYLCTNFETDFGDIFPTIAIDKDILEKGNNTLSSYDEYLIQKNKKNLALPVPFEYGYAITVHKAQGSQWDRVVVINERFPYKVDQHIRWLYTAITRAASKLIIINAPQGLDNLLRF